MEGRDQLLKPRRRGALWAAGLAVLAVLGGCTGSRGWPARLTIFLTADSRGYLEPCGCRRDQAGGLPGRATVIRSKGGGAKLVLDAGNLTSGGRAYELLKLGYLLRGMEAIGYDAVNLGRGEAELDLEALRNVLRGSRLPFVSANIVEKQGRTRVAEASRLIERNGLTIGVTGVAAAESGNVGPGLELRPAVEALAEVVPDLRRRCDYLIVLAFVDEETLRAIAARFHEIDCVLGGDVPQTSSSVQQINRAIVFSVTDRGKVLGEIDLAKNGNRYRVERAQGIKIVGDRLKPDPKMVELIGQYKDELRERRFELASAEGLERIPGQEGSADEFVGEQRCRSCHGSSHQVWDASGHRHAYETLVKKKSEYDPECLSCHTVGYGLHSGYVDASRTPELRGVQCESCHGRGKDHVRAMEQRAAAAASTFRAITPATCIRCHDRENSEGFRYATFWPKIAHGKEARQASR